MKSAPSPEKATVPKNRPQCNANRNGEGKGIGWGICGLFLSFLCPFLGSRQSYGVAAGAAHSLQDETEVGSDAKYVSSNCRTCGSAPHMAHRVRMFV